MPRHMPQQRPGRSRQDFATDRKLIMAILNRFGPLGLDLAANTSNTVCEKWLGPGSNLAEDALIVDWSQYTRYGQMWLNPPFGHILPWAVKCRGTMREGTSIFLLTPLSTANWTRYVYGHAHVMALRGRLTFEGESACYPKDCMVSWFHKGITGFEVWDWEKDL